MERPRVTLRSMRYKGKTVVVSARLPENLIAALDQAVDSRISQIDTRSDAICDALALWLAIEEKKRV